MSTRSVTVIQMDYIDRQLSLYRHSDGYLAVAGAALVEALDGATCPEQVAGRLLSMTYDTATEPRLRAVYHVTDSADAHGDAEHVYTAWLSPEGWRVRHSVAGVHTRRVCRGRERRAAAVEYTARPYPNRAAFFCRRVRP